MAHLQAAGQAGRQSATTLGRAPSTGAREVKRNRAPAGAYKPVYAAQQAQARRWRGSRLERAPTLRARGLAPRHQGWSPEQGAGRRALAAGRGGISPESLSRLPTVGPPEGLWVAPRPAAGQVEAGLARPQRGPAAFMAGRRPPGPWEADLRRFRTYGQAGLPLHERPSRLLLALRPPGQAARPSARALAQGLGQFPPA